MRNKITSFLKDRSGLAAIEFAFIAPIMVVLFFGVLEGSDALSASRRASLAVSTLADLVAQETQVGEDDLDDLFTGVTEVLASRTPTATFTVVSIIYNDTTKRVEVDWSYDSTGGAPYSPGSEYTGLADASLVNNTSSLVVGEVDYEYNSTLTSYIYDKITMKRAATRWPRRSAGVALCGATCP